MPGTTASREGAGGVGLELCGGRRGALRVRTPPRRHSALLLRPLVARLVPAQPQRHDGGRNKDQRIQPLQSQTSQCSPLAPRLNRDPAQSIRNRAHDRMASAKCWKDLLDS